MLKVVMLAVELVLTADDAFYKPNELGILEQNCGQVPCSRTLWQGLTQTKVGV